MSWAMDQPGDITDTFDDDSLRTSIEKAETTGQWRDATGTFVDPKLEKLKKQLSEPDRADYAERRRRDLQRRAEADAAALAAKNPAAAPTMPALPTQPPIDWRETVVKNPAVPPVTEPTEGDVFAQLQTRIGTDARTALPPEARLPALGYVRPILAGLSVFLPVTVVLMTVCGAQFDLLVRGLLASIAAGVCWSEFHAGRFRAPLIGVAVYVLTFVTTPGTWGSTEIIAHMVGFLMALLGSGVAGFLREESKPTERRRDGA